MADEDSERIIPLRDLSLHDLARLAADEVGGLDLDLGGRVLVADADPDIREYMGLILEALGIEVAYATTRAEAEHVLSTDELDLVLVDFVEDAAAARSIFDRLSVIAPNAAIRLFTDNWRAVASVAAKQQPPVEVEALWLPKPFDIETTLVPLLKSCLG